MSNVSTFCVLSLDKHVTNISATCFYHVRRLRHIRRALSKEPTATLVHAFVMSRIDNCNVVFAGPPKAVTNKLQPYGFKRGSSCGQWYPEV